MAVSGAAFAGTLPAEAARTAEAPGRTAEPAARADSTGAPCVGHSVCSGSPLCQHPREPPPTFPHTEAPMPRGGGINTWVGCGSRLGREGVSLEQGNPQRPRRGGGHEQGVQAQLPAKAKVRGCRQSQLGSPLCSSEGPLLVLQPGSPRPLSFLKAFSAETHTVLVNLPSLQTGKLRPREGKGLRALGPFLPCVTVRRRWALWSQASGREEQNLSSQSGL